jgi:putative tricarboxylic transport membrane protein
MQRSMRVCSSARRRWVSAGFAVALLAAGQAVALDNVKMMIPANPGGGYDKTGRTLGKAMQEAGTAKTVQYENKSGAGGTLGMVQFVNSAKGDPNAMLVMGLVMVGAIVQNKPPVTLANATPVARLYAEYNVFVVPANSPYKTMADVIAQLKKDPGSVKWGGGSTGSVDHISVGMIAKASGVAPNKINYISTAGGGEATAGVLGGHFSVGTGGYAEFAQFITSGKMRALAVTSSSRLPGSSVPTLKEQGIDVEIGNWRGVYGAPGMTAEQRKAMIDAVAAATKSKAWEEAVKTNDWTPSVQTGDEFGKFVDAELKRLGVVMKDLGLVQ